MYPPRMSTIATAEELRQVTMGMNMALSFAEWKLARYIRSVSPAKSPDMRSSIPRVLEVFAPVMPSLYAPVISEFMLRISRLALSMRFWKNHVTMAIGGTTARTIEASRAFIENIEAKANMI